jgi:hypothetical protein
MYREGSKMTIEKNLTREQDYTPLTFIRNAKRQGFKEAWGIDKTLTTERNPNLARINESGVGCVRNLNRSYKRSMSRAQTSLEKGLYFLGYGLSLATHALLGYMVGALGGLLGAKPEDLFTNGNNQTTQNQEAQR